MQDFLIEFEQYLNNTKRVSDNTLESYLRDIKQLLDYCKQLKISSVKNISEKTVNSYVEMLKHSGKSNSTISRNIASIKNYFIFLVSNGSVLKSPVINIKPEKATKKMPEILTSGEVKLLLSQPDVTDLKGCRDKAMLELLYSTGIKVSELVALRVSDINLSVGFLNLTEAKNSRVIPIYNDAIKSLHNYITNVRDVVVCNSEVEELFTNMSGQPMTRQGFWKLIKFYAEKADIKKDITPHTLRHSLAAHLLENGAPLKDIKEILGHADISSTQIYATMMKSKYTKNFKKYHPMAK